MKFSSREKEVITQLVQFAKGRNNEFFRVDSYFNSFLPKGVGIIAFSDDFPGRPRDILCLSLDTTSEEEYQNIEDDLIFKYYFFEKLERLGLITISPFCMQKDEEYALGCFGKNSIVGGFSKNTSNDDILWGYSFRLNNEVVSFDSKCIDLVRKNGATLNYHCYGLNRDINFHKLLCSKVLIGQELIELKENNYLTCEELTLKEAITQTGWSKAAVVLAIIAIIVAFLVPLLTSTKAIVKIDQKDLDSLKLFFDMSKEQVITQMENGVNTLCDSVTHSIDDGIQQLDKKLNDIDAKNTKTLKMIDRLSRNK